MRNAQGVMGAIGGGGTGYGLAAMLTGEAACSQERVSVS